MSIVGFPKNTPKEIKDFIIELFELHKICSKVMAKQNGISFYIYTNDHNPPHMHVKYAEYWIKISLVDYSVMEGNLPLKKQKEAIEWIKKNQKKMLKEWTKYTKLDGVVVQMISYLDSQPN